MAKAGRGQTRRDSKRRVLRPGESVRADRKYQYKYHIDGKPHFVYSWKLEPTDKLPKGKKPCLSLRELEKQVNTDLELLVNIVDGQMTVCELVDRYLKTKRGAVYELSSSIETTILLQAHDYVNPLLMAAAPTNKYYNIDQFTISHGKEKFISFSLVDEKDKKNPDSLAEATVTYPAEYVPNEDRVWTVYSLMTGFSGESVVEIGADEKVYAEYGLDEPEYTVAFEYDGRAYVIFFSGLTEDGYYYASSSIVPDTVVKVAADTAEFLSYDLFKWISPYPFGYYITQISSVGVKSGEYDLRFALKHSEDAKGNDVLEVASNDGTDFAPEEMVKNFRMYYKAMLGVEMIDYTGLSAEENAALAADGSNMMYSFTYTTLSGKETTIAFYPYSTRRCLVTINGKGEFYVLIDRVEKMISDTGKLLRGEEIDSFAKN